MTLDIEEAPGSCHCGAVTFRVQLSDGLRSVRRCNCSFCRMRGAVAVSAKRVEVVSGTELLTEYRFNTRAAIHYFCSVCGIYTHHQRRADPSKIGVNVACLAGISPFDFPEIPVSDGEHHPSDGFAPRLAGYLRYVANSNER